MPVLKKPAFLRLDDQDSSNASLFDPRSALDGSDPFSTPWAPSAAPAVSEALFAGASFAASASFAPQHFTSSTPTGGATHTTIGASSGGLFFNNTFAAGLSAQYLDCINATETFLSNLFTNNLTLNLSFDTFNDPTSNNALSNSWDSWTNVSYATLKAALPGTDVLPASDPNSAGGNDWSLPEAYARMLGLNSGTPTIDDTVKLNIGDSWSFGQDVINGLIHEISEGAMGRVGGLGDQNGVWSTMDLFRYTAAGAADYTDGRDSTTTFFSSNGGTSVSNANLPQKGAPTLSYNNEFNGATKSNGGDTADLTQQDVFGFVSSGETITLTQVDLDLFKALGWNVSLKQDTFNINGAGNWETADDWGQGAMPITMMDAAIGGFNTTQVTLSDDVLVYSISVNASSKLSILGGHTLTAMHGTFINPADSLFLYNGNQGTLNINPGATLLVGSGSLGVTFTNSGSLNVGLDLGFGGTGHFTYGSGANLTLDGGGHINLGSYSNQTFSTGVISGGDEVINVNNTIAGGGLVSGVLLDNKAAGSIIATQSDGDDPILRATNGFTNEGNLYVADRATMNFGLDGATESLVNSGVVFLGYDGTTAGLQGDLAISGNYAVSGTGTIRFKGAGSRIVSDGVSADTFTNKSSIIALASGQIGDAGVYGGVEDLTFVNSGSVAVSSAGVTLTLNTGTNKIADGGGLLEAENQATLVIDSPVTTGQFYLLAQVPPPGGTIEATTGGTVDIAAAVTSGVTFHFPFLTVPGQVVVDTGSSVVVQSGGSVQIPIKINGASGATPGGTLTLQSGGAISGTITFNGAGGVFHDTNSAARTFNFAGGGGAIQFSSSGNTANISKTTGVWDSVTGSHQTIAETSAQVSVVGGTNTISFIGGTGNQASLFSTNGNWDTVNGAGGQVNVTSSQVSVVGGSNTIAATAGSTMSLYSTAGNWDAVNGSSDQILLTTAQAAITGGSDTIAMNAGSSVSLSGTNGNWDAVNGSKDQIIMTHAEAAITGGSNTEWASAGSSASLFGTAGNWDTFNGSSDQITLNNAQASIVGGGDTIFATSGSSMSLYNTNGVADNVYGASDNLNLTNAQAGLTGGGDTIAFAGTNTLNISSGASENFYFAQTLGLTSIAGFQLSDVVHLSALDWTSFTALQNSGDLKQSGANTLIAIDANDTITLANVQVSSLTTSQFAFA